MAKALTSYDPAWRSSAFQLSGMSGMDGAVQSVSDWVVERACVPAARYFSRVASRLQRLQVAIGDGVRDVIDDASSNIARGHRLSGAS